MNLIDRYTGALLGLAAGDALGTTLEFKPRGSFTPITTIVGGGPFGLAAGQWTDDTSMAMCLAESLVKNGFDPADQMRRYVRWRRHGYWSSTKTCFDIGATVSAALRLFEQTGDPYAGSTDPYSAGNGSLMRLAPVILRHSREPAQAIHLAAESSRTTHGAADAVDACRYFGGLLLGALAGEDKGALLAPYYAPPEVSWVETPLSPAIGRVAFGSFQEKSEQDIRPSGYVVDTLEAALWAFHHSHTFRDGALLAVNLGGDADTTGAIYGQLAGAYYGVGAIPEEWRAVLTRAEDIAHLAARLFDLSTSAPSRT
jgi:ADP-ribosyl-[dinitrogen reductase] hydrolase